MKDNELTKFLKNKVNELESDCQELKKQINDRDRQDKILTDNRYSEFESIRIKCQNEIKKLHDD